MRLSVFNGTVTINSPKPVRSVDIFDTRGRKIACKKRIASSCEIGMNVEFLGRGVYLFVIHTNAGISVHNFLKH